MTGQGRAVDSKSTLENGEQGMLKQFIGNWGQAWNRFWFTPGNPATICVIRILAGLMLLYTHAVWTMELSTFFSPDGVLRDEYVKAFHGSSPFIWSHFWWSSSPIWMWTSHCLALVVLAAFTVGMWTRITSILSFLIVVSYANRAGGALFGLDQINCFLALYLAVGPSGAMYSLDAWWRRRKNGVSDEDQSSNPTTTFASKLTSATVATRLIQIHLCIVYLFAGLGKLQGVTWWDGTAIWGALASYEYQTIDMTFLVNFPWAVNILTLVSVFWELSYAFLIWPRLTRPIWIALAVPLHLGIGFCMGMMTFGLVMLIANVAFISPDLIQKLLGRWKRN